MKSSGGCRGEGVSSLKGVLRSAAVACLALDPAASSPSRGVCKARSSCHWPSTAFLQPHTVSPHDHWNTLSARGIQHAVMSRSIA
eukprot:39131-Eustigmatos_ZCMA.PRE.1